LSTPLTPATLTGASLRPVLELSLLLPLDVPDLAARALASLQRQSLPRDRYEIIGVGAGDPVRGGDAAATRSGLDWDLRAGGVGTPGDAKAGASARARSLNRATRLASGRIVVVCDAAAEFPPGFAECLASSFGAEGTRARQPVVTYSGISAPGAAPCKQALALFRQDAQLVMSAGDPDMPLEDVAWLLVESGAQHLRLDAAAPSTPAQAIDWRDVPVFIVNRNRHQALEQLVSWLTEAGTRKVVILDNGSTYPPLLAYYGRLPTGVNVMRLEKNFGPYVLWEQGVHEVMEMPFILTDSDLVPASFCPADLVSRLLEVMRQYPDATKVGPALRIDNLPDGYTDADTVRKWESQFWEHPVAPGVFAAPLDTTFALYPPKAEFSLDDRALRLGYPYIVEHTPWYAVESDLSAEERYYREHTSKTFSNWSVRGKQSKTYMSDRVKAFERRAKVLNIDDSGEHIPGWINAVARRSMAPDRALPLDIVLEVDGTRPLRLPLPDGCLDGIRLNHALDRLGDLGALLADLRRACRDHAKTQVRIDSRTKPVTTRNWQEAPCLQRLLKALPDLPWDLHEVRLVTDKGQLAQRLHKGSSPGSVEPVRTVVLTLSARPLRSAGATPAPAVPQPVLISDDRLDPNFTAAGSGLPGQAAQSSEQTRRATAETAA
jgi:hypothetical protein